eukprot:338337_1
MAHMFCLLMTTALSFSDSDSESSRSFYYDDSIAEIPPPPHIHSNLISLVMTYLSSQPTHNLWQDVFYPIARHHPTIFGSIVQRLLEDSHHLAFIELFISSAPKDIFMQYIEIDNAINSGAFISKLDLWKTLHLVSNTIIKSIEYHKLIHNVSYIATSNKFHITTNTISPHLAIQCVGQCFVNWSEIPHYVRSMHLQFFSWKRIVVDWSEMDQHIHVQKLEIDLRNGTVSFPDYSLPASLKKLKLINLSSQFDYIHYNKLWKVGSHIEELTLLTIHPEIFIGNKLHGIENMRDLRILQLSDRSRWLWLYRIKIIERFQNAGIYNKSLTVTLYHDWTSSINITTRVLEDDVVLSLIGNDTYNHQSCIPWQAFVVVFCLFVVIAIASIAVI